MTATLAELERRLWDAADELRANSRLKASEYSVPVLGLIFLKFADQRFSAAEDAISAGASGRRAIGKVDFQARGVLFLPPEARFDRLLALTERDDVARAVNDAMRAIERENEDLRGVLPTNYSVLDNSTLVELLKLMSSIPTDIEGDAFGRIYEYFLANFAMTEGQKGGEFFTPTSIVRLIVEIIEPFHGRIYDPACGSGGMFVQSARFVENHQRDPSAEISIFGQEKTSETVRLCKMNLAVHGLSGDIREANSYYEDIHEAVDRFDYVMANPPFNVDRVNKDRIKDDRSRFPFGTPTPDNANYLWIQLFYSSLAEAGRAGFVMANSAADARSESAIREQLINSGAVDTVVAIGSKFFYTVPLGCTLWFLDRAKSGTPRANEILFIDARHIYRQIDRAHRDFTPEQIEYIANIVRAHRGEDLVFDNGSKALVGDAFPDGTYRDVAGLCAAVPVSTVAKNRWSLNPGRYVGVADREPDGFVFAERLEELSEELGTLQIEARTLEEQIGSSVAELLDHA